MKALTEYKKKRDFTVTAEPAGRVKSGRGHSFVIQKHDATRLHYDFRLELDGVLKSWAVPKGPSLDPHVKRLAVEVEDHPLDYAGFEGTIPAGQYGAGEVIVWDRGTWSPIGDAHQQLRAGRLRFMLNGEKLHGIWNLVRTRQNAAKPSWLLFKAQDAEARPESEYDVTEKRAESVLSGELIRERKRSVRKLTVQPAVRPSAKSKLKPPARLSRDPMLDFIKPELATLVAEPPAEKYFIYEIKFDGYRALARIHLDSGRVNKRAKQTQAVTLYTRNGNDWTQKFASIAAALERFEVESAYLDGEIVVLGSKGKSDFQALQNALSDRLDLSLSYMVFDLLYLNGHDLRREPLANRKELLKFLLEQNPDEHIHYSDHVAGNGLAFLRHSCKRGLEGIICKDGRQPYVSGRTLDWLKIKCINRQEFVIVGYSEPKGNRQHFGALLLAVRESSGQLRYVGRVGTGFSQESLAQLRSQLGALIVDKPPVQNSPRARDITWVRPKLIAEVQFGHFTQDKILRQAVFCGLREDKTPQEIVFESPLPKSERKAVEAEGTRLTHPDKVLFPPDGPTKQELVDYYRLVGRRMWRYVERRPLALLRCPEGYKKECFFQKHVEKGHAEPGLLTTTITEKGGATEYRYLVAPLGLESLVQLGVLELHLWGARVTQVEHPDELVFDLDPGPDVAWKQVVMAAKKVRDMLALLKLKSFPKLTGGKGLHLHVPIAPRYTWTQVKSFCAALAKQLAENHPTIFTATAVKAKRAGKIYIDFLRNQRGAHYIAPFSPRAREGAPIAVPISWPALTPRLLPNSYTVRTIAKYFQTYKRDPWAGYSKQAQRISLLE